jgi:phage FluMu protein Com
MGKFSPMGKFFLHSIVISFGLIIITILKNFNFSDWRNTSHLTTNQITFIMIFLIVGILVCIVFLTWGYTIKTPKYYTRTGAAVVMIVIGICLILGMWFHDQVIGNEQDIGVTEMLFIILGSMITSIGSLAYLAVKFPDEIMMKYFKEAVREEIKSKREEERKIAQYEAELRRQERGRKKVKTKGKNKSKAKKAVSDATEVAPIDYGMPETEMSPPESIGISIIKCSKCGKSMKLTSTERPLAIKCPYCEEVGVIKE